MANEAHATPSGHFLRFLRFLRKASAWSSLDLGGWMRPKTPCAKQGQQQATLFRSTKL
jgi:hypothetical protein